jgi:phosphoribosyl 1,2-cyclic phosphate phosphodiesterase
MKVTVLGCGGSGGVPLITGDWGRCNPGNPKNRRRRVSVLVEQGDTTILIDTSPDLRAQFLDAGVTRLDAVLYTHEHADHCHGIDELRAFGNGRKDGAIPAYGMAGTLDLLRQRFRYIFEQSGDGSGVLYRPLLEARIVDGPFIVKDIPVMPFVQDHGYGTTTTGYRIGGMAYSTDVVGLDDAAFAVIENLDLWIVDCLRYEPHPTHAHFDLTLSWIARAKPKRAILTHLNHLLDYDDLASRCPPGVEPGYDGLVVEIDDAVSNSV